MKIFVQTFAVIGKGSFPIDMLRYDHCFPDSESDAAVIEASFRPRDAGVERRVILRRHVERSGDFPTYMRWASFGWALPVEEAHSRLVSA